VYSLSGAPVVGRQGQVEGVRQLNNIYTQDFNRRDGLVGHLFQGWFKAIPVARKRSPRGRSKLGVHGVKAVRPAQAG
jgi:hypothetical protein